MPADLHLSSITIIESLPSGDIQTGSVLAGYIRGLEQPLPVDVRRCQTAGEVMACLRNLVAEAVDGNIPVLHFECHGTYDGSGLVTANDDVLDWPDVASILRKINAATGFNLLVFVAACNGGYFLSHVSTVEAAPCFGLIAPTEEVDAAEIMRGTRDFYRTLLTSFDAGLAVSTLSRDRLDAGQWFGQLAEAWYRVVVVNYLKTHCTSVAIDERARRMHRQAKATGQRLSIGSAKRGLRKRNKEKLGDYFDRYFLVAEVPVNSLRFKATRDVVALEVREILSRPEYR